MQLHSIQDPVTVVVSDYSKATEADITGNTLRESRRRPLPTHPVWSTCSSQLLKATKLSIVGSGPAQSILLQLRLSSSAIQTLPTSRVMD